MIIKNSLLKCDIVKDFIKKYDFPKELKIKIIVTDDIESEYKKQLKKLNKPYDYISPIDYNGLTCVPDKIEEETIILINYERIKNLKTNNFEVICTIFHELIHAKDYYIYYKKYCNGLYDSSKDRNSQYGFRYWSEFNAKKISYYEYCKLVYGEKINSKKELNNILKYELPIKNKEIEDLLNNKDSDIEYIIYQLMFYLGRYSVWEELFPKEFRKNKKLSNVLLIYESLITELYKLLKNNSGEKEEYKKITGMLNYFKGAWINSLTNKNQKN